MREYKFSASMKDTIPRYSNGLPRDAEKYDPAKEERFLRARRLENLGRAMHAQMFRREFQRNLREQLDNLNVGAVSELEPTTVQVDDGYLTIGAGINLPQVYLDGENTEDDDFSGVSLMTYHYEPDAYNSVNGRIIAARAGEAQWEVPKVWDYVMLPDGATYRVGEAKKPNLLEIVKLEAALVQAKFEIEEAA